MQLHVVGPSLNFVVDFFVPDYGAYPDVYSELH